MTNRDKLEVMDYMWRQMDAMCKDGTSFEKALDTFRQEMYDMTMNVEREAEGMVNFASIMRDRYE